MVIPVDLLKTWFDGRLTIPPSSTSEWVIVTVVSYILGYVMAGVFENWLAKISEFLSRSLLKLENFVSIRFLSFLIRIPRAVLLPNVFDQTQFESDQQQQVIYKVFLNNLTDEFSGDLANPKFRELRNVAMSVSKDNTSTYRFSFMASLCGGIASATAMVMLIVGGLLIYSALSNGTVSLGSETTSTWWYLPLSVILFFTVDRRYRYHGISMRIPFAVGIASLLETRKQQHD